MIAEQEAGSGDQLLQVQLIRKNDPRSCIFNLVLPSGAVLKLDGSSSLRGLGGYHGSVRTTVPQGRTLYYSANVFSEFLPNGKENGIVAFNRPWKNVVGTLYHEINEFRTDADVNDAILKNDNDFLGWASRDGREIGDQPIFRAGADLRLVFKEVGARPSGRRIRAFMYSNAVHGAEGPNPHAPISNASSLARETS